MKDYYEILDVPLTATPEEIKSQYRQLVRIYHPDRFRDQDDKAYAEEKLKEINIAFQVLSGTSVRREPFEARVGPQPVAYPPHLNFGAVPAGQKATRKLQIGNIGGPAESINFVYSCEKPWFQVGKGKRVYSQKAFPLDFEVTVNTKRLQPGQHYQEWLEAVLDGIPVRITVQLQVAERERVRVLPLHFGWTAAGVLLILAALFFLPLLGLNNSLFSLSEGLISERPVYELHSNEMLFAVQENNTSALYVGAGAEKRPQRLNIFGEQAVATQVGQRIAYLDLVGGVEQLFVFDLASGEPKQLTTSEMPKSQMAWSSNGTQIAYLMGEGQVQEVGLYDIRTNKERRLSGGVSSAVDRFIWAPNGQTLLLNVWEAGERRVYSVNTRGDQLRQLTYVDSWAGAWSADSHEFILSTTSGLYLFNTNGEKLSQITDTVAESVSWSADEAWIAYTASAHSQENASVVDASPQATSPGVTLWLMELSTHDVHSIAHDVLWHQWSPNGTTLGYVTGNSDSENSLFYLWALNPGETPQLVAEISEPYFTWPR